MKNPETKTDILDIDYIKIPLKNWNSINSNSHQSLRIIQHFKERLGLAALKRIELENLSKITNQNYENALKEINKIESQLATLSIIYNESCVKLEDTENELANTRTKYQLLKNKYLVTQERLDKKELKLQEIHSSVAWKLFYPYRKLAKWLNQ